MEKDEIRAFDMRNGITFIGKIVGFHSDFIKLEDVVRIETGYITTPEVTRKIYNRNPHFSSAEVLTAKIIANYVVGQEASKKQ